MRDCLVNVQLAEHYGDGERAAHNQIVLGSGDALDATLQGITVNWKGTGCQSNTEFIARLDETTLSAWRERLADAEHLQGLRVGVEDLGPDTCLSFICLYARLNGADPADLPSQWVDYANRWEQGDVKTTGQPLESWGCLLSALGHSYWQRTPAKGDAPGQISPKQLKSGFVVCLRFTLGLLLSGCQPDRVARSDAGNLDEYHQALALVDYERKVYLQALQHAELVQLLMPLRDSNRKALVDVFIASDLALTGTIKSFIRNDAEHPWLCTGFAVMALHRPTERGTGNDITISADPSSRITLEALHQEIEALETERWSAQGKSRPADHPRRGFDWNEPWYLEPVNKSLIGAPHWLVKDALHGSKLKWEDVMSVLWRLYSPARDLRTKPLPKLPAQDKKFDPAGPACKHFRAVKWLSDGIEQSIVLSPTMKRYLIATALLPGDELPAIEMNDLPRETSFDFLALPGGFALIHRDGTFLMDDSSRESLAVNSYVAEFDEADRRCRVLAQIGQALKAQNGLLKKLAWSHSTTELSSGNRQSLRALAAKRSLLMAAMLETTPRASDLHAATFREMLEKRYGIASQLEQYYALLGELEARLKRDSDARSQKLQARLSLSQDRARKAAEITQAVISGLAAFIVVMAIWTDMEKHNPKFVESLKSQYHLIDAVPMWVALVLGVIVMLALGNKARFPSHAEAHHEEDESGAFILETAAHAGHAIHEPQEEQSGHAHDETVKALPDVRGHT